jgi:hypothetical protein
MTRTFGWKILGPMLNTNYNGVDYFYPAPAPGEKWSGWIEHPHPGEYDGQACGPGGWHYMRTKGPDARFVSMNQWWPWFVEVENILGEEKIKGRAVRMRLKRVRPRVFWKMIRWGWLRGADLHRADLHEADLRWADLSEADLRGANLRWADLSWANLYEANLYEADLRWADHNKLTFFPERFNMGRLEGE